MSEKIRSGIFFLASRMRYAEVEHVRSGLRLLRLGSCDFDFDAEHAVLTGAARKLETVAEAVGDVFSGSRSSDFSVVLPPSSVMSFFSPVSDQLPEEAKKKQLEAETVLIGGGDTAFNVVAEPVMSEADEGVEKVTWYHVAAVPAAVRRNVAACLASFPDTRHHIVAAMQAGTRVAGRFDRPRAKESDRPAAAVVGCFADVTEVALLDAGRWRFGARTRSTQPADIAYTLLNTAGQVGIPVERLGRIYVYGDEADSPVLGALRAASAAEVMKLDPLAVVHSDPVKVQSAFTPDHYVLPVGAAL